MYDVKQSLAGQLSSIYNIYTVAGGGVVVAGGIMPLWDEERGDSICNIYRITDYSPQ